MKHLLTMALSATAVLSGCGKRESGVAAVIDSLESRAEAAEKRAAQAEQEILEAKAAHRKLRLQLDEQRLAAESENIERERMRIEELRSEVERLRQERLESALADLQKQEELLARREDAVTESRIALGARQDVLEERAALLDQRDQELAGREAAGDLTENPGPDFNVSGTHVFYDTLNAYGSWFDSPDYGYVWRPAAAHSATWRPYTRGRWACTDRGWMWLSDEPFGWATYHYGRWARCRTNGWLWVPGTEWAPSWVCWRSGSSHIGWAPLPPETLAYQGRIWDSSVEITFGIGSSWFCFVESGNFYRPIYNHCLPINHHSRFWNETSNVTYIHHQNNRVICGGPRFMDVQRQTKHRAPYYRIEETRKHPGTPRVPQNPLVRNGRIAIPNPRGDESRNASGAARLPGSVRGRLEHIEVDREKPVDSRIIADFRKERRLEERRGITAGKDAGHPMKPTARDERKIRPGQPVGRHQVQVLPRQFDERIADGSVTSSKSESTRAGQRSQIGERTPIRPRLEASIHNHKPGQSNVSGLKFDRAEQRRNIEAAQNLQSRMRLKDDRIRVLPLAVNRKTGLGPKHSQPLNPTSPKPYPSKPTAQPNGVQNARFPQQRQFQSTSGRTAEPWKMNRKN